MEGIVHHAAFVEFVAQALGEQRFTLLDIGCSGGIDSAWRQFGKQLRAFGFDPNLKEVERLNSSPKPCDEEYIGCFVGIPPNSPGAERMATQTFWDRSPWARLSVAETLELRSRLVDPADNAEKTRLNLWQETQLADIRKPIILSEFVENRGIDDVDFIKIDVDGPDFLILRSIIPMLETKRVLGVGVEVNFFGSDHPDANTFHNVDRMLKGAGFELFDLSLRRYSLAALPSPYLFSFPAQSKSGRPIQGDALYLRDVGGTGRSQVECEQTAAKIAKLAALFSLFGQPDSAAELLLLHRETVSTILDVDAGLKALLMQAQPASSGTSYADYIAAFRSDDPRFYRGNEEPPVRTETLPNAEVFKENRFRHLIRAISEVFQMRVRLDDKAKATGVEA